MNHSTHPAIKPSFLLITLLGSVLFTSCGSPPNTHSAQMPMTLASPAVPGSADNAVTNEVAQAPSEPGVQGEVAAKPLQARTQLIRKAQISLSVTSIEKSISAVSQIVKQKQGDLLAFQDQKPLKDNSRHTASMEIRVPQEQLEITLDALAELGTIQNRTLTAEDVTTQLVDAEARLRNLRNQESTLLKIMDRSGSVGDVLKVSNELSKVRQTIEQIDAQLKSLRSQVAYSTITLQLEKDITSIPTERPLGKRVQETWNQSTYAVSEFTVGLLLVGTGLLPWTPFLLLMGGGAYSLIRLRKQQNRPSVQHPPNARP